MRHLNLGQKRTDETKQRLSSAWKNKPKFKCIHCGLVCAAHTHNRWHGNNCKSIHDLDNRIQPCATIYSSSDRIPLAIDQTAGIGNLGYT